MSHHKRRRAKAQRAGCYCGGKLGKARFKPLRLSSTAQQYGSRAAALRLRERARDAA